MKHSVFAGKPPRLSAFDLSHEHKLTMNMGTLVPAMCLEVMPGDTLTINSDMFMRLMPLAAPMMHRVDTYMHYFFVPSRLVWQNWDEFLTGGVDGTAVPEYPTVNLVNTQSDDREFLGSLYDYFGLPIPMSGQQLNPVSALPLRAYNLIYNEWYRDENLIEEAAVPTTDGVDDQALYVVRRRAWKKGYFESALPWTQRGEQVSVPLDGRAPVIGLNGVVTRLRVAEGWEYDDDGNQIPSGTLRRILGNTQSDATDGSFDPSLGNNKVLGNAGGSGTKTGYEQTTYASYANLNEWTGLVADVANGAGISIQSLRLASAIQRFMEKNARGGIRYIEWLRAHFGVKSSDARLQRPEYLGGGKSPVVIGEVVQTSETETTPQGTMAGQGISAQRSLGFTRSFEEFGYVICIMSVLPRATYEQGIPRMWLRHGRYDQILPEFAGIGDQAVANQELYAQSANPTDAFGYVPRFEELRRIPSSVHGEFRVANGTLGYWHLGRYFEQEPTLSKEFVECDPSDRVFAVQDGSDKLLVDIFHNVKALRPIPLNGVPGIRAL